MYNFSIEFIFDLVKRKSHHVKFNLALYSVIRWSDYNVVINYHCERECQHPWWTDGVASITIKNQQKK